MKNSRLKKLAYKITVGFIFLISTGCLFSCVHTPRTMNTSTGVVSFYHDKFNGRKTANGEIFNNEKLTAAHPTLPFGSRVKITNLKTQKNVVIRVNDRGPFVKDRVFDLSRSAFEKLGNTSSGTMFVCYEVL